MTAAALGVAADGGAREALAAIAHWSEFRWADDGPGSDLGGWRRAIAGGNWRILVAGASDSAAGRAIETAARRAASAAGLKTVVVEDFPGNYYPVEGSRVDLLIAESEQAAALIRARWGASAPPMEVFPSVRYDPHRRRLGALRGSRAEDAGRDVLWAGQPETEDCLCTLAALAPALATCGARVLFKAHPRDPAYSAGAYPAALAALGLEYADVTALSVGDALALGPRLVVTQFSSVGVEAGFFGIPALNILLPEAGGARLREKKGYDIPPWCATGASFFADKPTQIKGLIETALYDPGRRAAIIANFDAYFAPYAKVAPALIRRLSSL